MIFKSKCLTLSLPVPLLIFACIGFVGAILTQIGDLFESGIKRKVGIKDMGKIMGALKSKYAGQLDMGKANGIIKSLLG